MGKVGADGVHKTDSQDAHEGDDGEAEGVEGVEEDLANESIEVHIGDAAVEVEIDILEEGLMRKPSPLPE
jgi:hypothetical protein